jgi:dUTP pyrophosphatase
MLIYLAHPIDQRKNKIKNGLDRHVESIKHSITNTAHHIYHPAGAFKIGRKATVDWTVEHINKQAQDASDALLVVLPKDTPTWGVPVEIERARANGQPVAILSDAPQTWSMPTDDPNVQWYYPDPGNTIKAIKWMETKYTPRRRDLGTVKWTKNADGGQEPTRAYPDDAGFDLYVSTSVTIPPQSFEDVHTDVSMELPSDSWGMLTGRSSTLRKKGLLVNQGIIDTGYRGELFIGCWNLTDKPVTLEPGDRVGQIIVLTNRTAALSLTQVDTLSSHQRGLKGFGSTGN